MELFTAAVACSCLRSLCCTCHVVFLCNVKQRLSSVYPHAVAGMDCPRVRYPQLNDVVEADLAEQGYQVLTDAGQQVDKVIQLYEVTA